MLVVGIAVLVASVLIYIFGTSYIAGEYRKLGYDRRNPDALPLDAEVTPHVSRLLGLLVLASYPGALIGVLLIVFGIF